MSNEIDRSDFVGLQKDVEFNARIIEENKGRLSKKADRNEVKESIQEVRDKLDEKSSKSDVSLLQKIVFGTVATILAAFLAALIQLVL